MKKVYLLVAMIISISILLLGCTKESINNKGDFGFEKTKKIEILSLDS